MSTRSAIGYMTPKGNLRAVYCHNDGYLDGVGRMLNENYQAAYKVGQLVETGDLSSVDKEIADCVYFGRDRGEEDTETNQFDSLKDFMGNYGEDFEFVYVYTTKGWTVCEISEYLGEFEFVNLPDAIEKELQGA